MKGRNLHHGVTEQRKAGRHRLQDARILFGNERWRGAMYLGGYAVECLLKAKLMEMYGCWHLRQLERELQRRGLLSTDATVFTHHLDRLLRLTNGAARLQQNLELWGRFGVVNRWVPAWRYFTSYATERKADGFLHSVELVYDWLENNI